MKSLYCALAAVIVAGWAGTAAASTIYAASFLTDSLHLIDSEAGTVSMVGAFGADFTEGGLSLDSSGALYGAFAGSLDALYSIDTSSGLATPVNTNGFGFADVSGIAFSPTDVLFGIDSATEQLLTIDVLTGQAAVFGDGDVGADIGSVAGMAFSASGDLYMVDSLNDSLYVFSNLGSGDDTATLLGSLGLVRPAGLTFAVNDPLRSPGVETPLYVVNAPAGAASELYTIEILQPGSLDVQPVSMVDTVPDGVGGLAGIIPEPATLLTLGMGALAMLRRKR
ncbi:MAG: PEP-CTERM sorting domain-containing protein [bacterium]|nr:PEP-CTERM sorting domain-containing protein [bacterium]